MLQPVLDVGWLCPPDLISGPGVSQIVFREHGRHWIARLSCNYVIVRPSDSLCF